METALYLFSVTAYPGGRECSATNVSQLLTKFYI